jgi:hypothetical protein
MPQCSQMTNWASIRSRYLVSITSFYLVVRTVSSSEYLTLNVRTIILNYELQKHVEEVIFV